MKSLLKNDSHGICLTKEQKSKLVLHVHLFLGLGALLFRVVHGCAFCEFDGFILFGLLFSLLLLFLPSAIDAPDDAGDAGDALHQFAEAGQVD